MSRPESFAVGEKRGPNGVKELIIDIHWFHCAGSSTVATPHTHSCTGSVVVNVIVVVVIFVNESIYISAYLRDT